MKDMNKDKIELIYRYNSLLDNYTLIKVNEKILKDITVSDMGYYTNNFGKLFMALKLNIPLDKCEVVINPDNKEKLNKK